MEAGCYDIARLLRTFESIGENCDFGRVQRFMGVEPEGLFRFAACTAPNLVKLLQARLEPLGDPGDLYLGHIENSQEYILHARSFVYKAHTFAFPDSADRKIVLARQETRLRTLKASILRDLRTGRKLFIMRSSVLACRIREVSVEMRRYGDNGLLVVGIANDGQAPGSVERIADGILQGWVGRLGTQMPIVDWITVCLNAYRLWREAEPPLASAENLLSRVAEAGNWCRSDCHRMAETGKHRVSAMTVPRPTGGGLVFSLWLLVPEGFQGGEIRLSIDGVTPIAGRAANLKVQGHWQFVWIAVRLPEVTGRSAGSVRCELWVEGQPNDFFHSKSWCLEPGIRPSGWGFHVDRETSLLPILASDEAEATPEELKPRQLAVAWDLNSR